MEVFNRCVRMRHVLLTLECRADVHPSLVTLRVDWDFTIPYGILYQLHPDANIERFLSALTEKLSLKQKSSASV